MTTGTIAARPALAAAAGRRRELPGGRLSDAVTGAEPGLEGLRRRLCFNPLRGANTAPNADGWPTCAVRPSARPATSSCWVRRASWSARRAAFLVGHVIAAVKLSGVAGAQALGWPPWVAAAARSRRRHWRRSCARRPVRSRRAWRSMRSDRHAWRRAPLSRFPTMGGWGGVLWRRAGDRARPGRWPAYTGFRHRGLGVYFAGRNLYGRRAKSLNPGSTRPASATLSGWTAQRRTPIEPDSTGVRH